VRDASRILAGAKDERRALTPDERRDVDHLQGQLVDLAPEIADEEERRMRILEGAESANGPATSNASRTFAGMFPHAAHDRGGFAKAGDLYAALLRKDLSRFATISYGAASFGTGASDTSGGFGYIVPPGYAGQIFDNALGGEIVRSRATVFPMVSDSLSVAGFSHDTGQDASGKPQRFGMTINTGIAMGSQLAAQMPSLRGVALIARKTGGLIAIPNEILADAPNAEKQLTLILSRALGWTLDRLFLTGDDAAAPQGVLSSPALIVCPKESAQVAATIVGANLAAMMSRLEPSALGNPSTAWVCSPSALSSLLTASMLSGALTPVVRQGTSPGSFSMLGIPLLVSEHLPALGAQGDILLADFSDYAVGMREDYAIASSDALYFDYDVTAFRALVRVDGRGLWDKPYVPSGSTTTVSPFVTLAVRA